MFSSRCESRRGRGDDAVVELATVTKSINLARERGHLPELAHEELVKLVA